MKGRKYFKIMKSISFCICINNKRGLLEQIFVKCTLFLQRLCSFALRLHDLSLAGELIWRVNRNANRWRKIC